SHGGRIDSIYACTGLDGDNPHCRKPNPGMGEQAKVDFPAIDFDRSIMVGDSLTDILFGKGLGMKTVFLRGKLEDEARIDDLSPDLICDDLWTFSQKIIAPIKNKL
ncbi:MAG: HAD-IIIA family hydrolase, partial [Bacteroidota bacterium]